MLRLTTLFLFLSLNIHAEQFLMFVGTYTIEGGKSKGIYAFRFDSATGKAEPLGLAAETLSPSWLALSPNKRFLYAANEQNEGSITSFALDGATGKLKLLNVVPSQGKSPCQIELDHAGSVLYSANYAGGTIAKFPVHADGSLGEADWVVRLKGSGINPVRQKGPHPHSVRVTEDGHIIVPDLGQDKVLIYKADLTPESSFAPIKAGSGPRHIAFHPNGKIMYVLNEMGSSITVLTRDNLSQLQHISTLPQGFTGPSRGAEVQVHPSGKFVYASNRGPDTIALFSADEKGLLKSTGYVSTQGKTPRGFVLDPTGNWLIAGNKDSDTMIIFKINPSSGKLTPAGPPIAVGAPASFQFVSIGH